MSVAAGWMAAAGSERLRVELGRAALRVRLLKLLCMIAFAVAFWYSVPYVLPFVPGNSLDRAASAANDAQAGNLSRQIAMPLVGVLSVFLLWRLPKRGRVGGRMAYFVIAYIVWAVMSVAWSESPALSAKRIVVFLLNLLFAYMVARVFSTMELALMGFMATGSVAALAVYSDVVMQRIFSPSNAEYRFQGVTTANFQAMSLCVLLFCIAALMDRKPSWTGRLSAMAVIAWGLLFMTRSRMSFVLGTVMVFFMLVRHARTRWSAASRAMIVVAAVAVVLPALIYVAVSKGSRAVQTAFMLGRDDTQNTASLSNRMPLWQELSESIAEKPLLGFGYEAFWNADRVARISADQGWTVPHAHNSYLDQVLSLGVVGAFFYAMVLWWACAAAWRRYRASRDAGALLIAVLLTWLALEGLTESAPIDAYLPTLLAYACVMKMCLVAGSEKDADAFVGEQEFVTTLTPADLERLPAEQHAEATKLLAGGRA
ncbi:O-antigen ligase family protein [Granulicella cerasi]|uniref:O-antigen ligase family protein n=1 Tax=Granulicella cerasi TaxID=741063 RepID=A0ABW1Z6I2_9BACT|nr:O-antigen ligase family protein [Granulicella cerasi]